MRDCPSWVRFKLVPRGDKVTKVPIQLNGRNASSTNPATWAPYHAVRSSTVGDGFGWVLRAGIGCIDLDDCFSGGRLKPWAAEILEKYRRRALLVERSLSGKGIHIFLRMKPGAGRRIRDGRNIEVYPPSSGRFIAMTLDRFDLAKDGVLVEKELKPCGTTAAARRHRRNKETVCDACRAAEAAARAAAAKAKIEKAREEAAALAETVPENLDQAGELRFLYARVRGALLRAEPKEVAALVKQGDMLLERLAHIDGGGAAAAAEPATDEIEMMRQSRGQRRIS